MACRDWIRSASRAAAALLFVASAAVSWAQDYTTTTTGVSAAETRPSDAVRLSSISSNSTNSSAVVDLPFEFPYYGRLASKMHVLGHGWVIFGDFAGILNSQSNFGNNGADWTTGAFPYTPNGKGLERGLDGFVSPLWASYGGMNTGTGDPNDGGVYTWLAGTAPNRRFVVAWQNALISGSNPSTTRVAVQLHLFEGSGQIEFRYSTGANDFVGTSLKYVCGLDSYDDARFTAPRGASNQVIGAPGPGIRFTPRTTTFTGRVRYDKLVSDASGIGKTIAADRDLGGFRLEVRRDGGILANAATTASDGTFSASGIGVAPTSTGSLHLVATNAACRVAPSLTAPTTSWTMSSGLSFSAASSVGTVKLSSVNDASASLRAAFNIALVCGAARDWTTSRTTAAIPSIDVVFDDTAWATTTLSKTPTSAPTMAVAGAAASNPDAWDDALVTRTYARHVLGAISGYPTGDSDSRFDAATSAPNAFAEGFGYALWAAVSGSYKAVDGTSGNTATVLDLEDPSLTVARGRDVAGAVAAALVDLVDANNESIDRIDGTAASDRFLRVADTLTVSPTVDSFLQAWVDAGHDAATLVRCFVGNGVVTDDDAEPNDDSGEVASLGAVGLRKDARVLHRFNDDWYSVSLPSAAASLVVTVAYDRAAVPGSLTVELRNGAGTVIATAAPVGLDGPYRIVTGAVARGTYHVGVRHASGVTIPVYRLQAYLPLDLAAAPIRDWTFGRPYDQALDITGGVPPYALRTTTGALPPGVFVDATTLRAAGTPTQAGSFPYSLELSDSAFPANVASRAQTVRIQPPLDLAVAPFIGFPLGAVPGAELTHLGGTPPLSLSVASGALPDGLSLAPGTFRVIGAADTAGSTPVRLVATDVAGSTDEVAATAVVCPEGAVRGVPLGLAAGDAACGVWIDAVRGSTLRFGAVTAKKAPRRPLEATVLTPDRSAAAGGKIRVKTGSATGSGVPCPESGRYYVVVWSTDGEATDLVASVSAAAPKGAKGKFPAFDPTAVVEVPFGALPGARVTFKATGDKKKGLALRFAGLRAPDGTLLPLDGLKATLSATGFTLAADLPTGGTWTVLVAASPQSQQVGAASYSFTLKQPKRAVYVAE